MVICFLQLKCPDSSHFSCSSFTPLPEKKSRRRRKKKKEKKKKEKKLKKRKKKIPLVLLLVLSLSTHHPPSLFFFFCRLQFSQGTWSGGRLGQWGGMLRRGMKMNRGRVNGYSLRTVALCTEVSLLCSAISERSFWWMVNPAGWGG